MVDISTVQEWAVWIAIAASMGAAASWSWCPLLTGTVRLHAKRTGRWTVAFLTVVGLVSAAVSAVAQSVVWLDVMPLTEWHWAPPAAVTVMVITGQAFLLRPRGARAGRELGRSAWRAVRDDEAELEWWFRVRSARARSVAVWAWLPAGYLLGAYVWALFVLPFQPPQAARFDVLALLLLGLTVAGGGALLGTARLLPVATLTSRLLQKPTRRWSANLGTNQSGARTPALMQNALRRRERRLPVSQRARFAAARRLLVDVVQLTEGTGHSSLRSRSLNRDSHRMAVRLSVGADPQAALTVFDGFVVRWQLAGHNPTDQPRWTVARLGEAVSGVKEVVSASAAIAAITAVVILTVSDGSLDGLPGLR